MIEIIREPIGRDKLQELASEIGSYIKVVADLERKVLAAGAKMHVDEEEALINDGSAKENLWGGGFDLEEKEIYFDSIINLRSGINESNEILDKDARERFVEIIRKLFPL